MDRAEVQYLRTAEAECLIQIESAKAREKIYRERLTSIRIKLQYLISGGE